MKKCLILHGWGGKSSSNWFPWLKEVMEERGCEVILPDLPETMIPNYDKQIGYLNSLNLDLGEGDLIFGHSLGSKLALHYVEENNLKGVKVYLVASVYPGLAEELGRPIYGDAYDDIKEYIDKENSFEKLGNDYKVFISHDDRFIDPKKVEKFLGKLESKEFIHFDNMGHFNEGSGITEFPEMLEY